MIEPLHSDEQIKAASEKGIGLGRGWIIYLDEPQHSPLPWQLDSPSDWQSIVDANGYEVLRDSDYDSAAYVEADLFPLIVRAVNNHDPMLAMLKKLHDSIGTRIIDLAEVRAVIADAEKP